MENNQKKKPASLLTQFLIFSFILLIANILSIGISVILPEFPVPTPLIGLVLLFIALVSGLVKLEQVESLSTNLIGLIGLLFVPSGISLISSLTLFKQEGIKIIVVVIISTVVLLLSVAYTSQLVAKISDKIHHKL
ncbi:MULTISPECIES: CidA/LrgA family protein [Leuconostoc]|uniref:Murein hydrolase regulator LrgA n=1 Tax=Leuconostoc falkenbergense TaxID=2766470 RepID=A0A9X3EB11_9LACO|nr:MULTISPECIES: CidA/LrgA family protein [Leuconostoc]MCX7579792.1 murein hydrolase regulator LrgA [Leuconostoc falkenbergense]QXC53245.1 murein hydrolase regulator LrgA [Leuconostoc mesenteroides]